MKSKLALILSVIMVCALFASCGSSPAGSTASQSTAPAAESTPQSTAQAPATDSAAAVEIRASWWGDTVRHELYNKIIDGFVAQHPNVTVVREPSSWADYWDKLAVQTAGGNAPDFMGMHPQFASDYIGRGTIAALDEYVADGTIDLSGWQEGVVNTGVIKGVNYMVPMGITFSCTFINVGKMNELGITVPSRDWTWDDVKTIGMEVREKFDAAGQKNAWLMDDQSPTLQYWRYYLRQFGHELYDQDGKANFTAELAQSYWEMFKEFQELGIVADPATNTEYANATLEDSLFSRDMTLVRSVPVNQYKLYRTTFPDKEIAIIRNPSAAGKAVGEYPEGAHFAVSANASDDKKKAAAQLLNHWVNTPESLALFGLDQGVPGNDTLQSAYESNLDEYQKEILAFATDVFKFATPSTFPPKGASEVDALFKSIGEQVMFGQLDPASAAQKFYTEALVVIEKNAAQ